MCPPYNTTSGSPPLAPPLRITSTTSQPTSPPCAPPLLNSSPIVNPAPVGVDAPVAAARSIRCRPSQGRPGRKNRMIISKKTSDIVTSTGKKIKLEYSKFHSGPKTCKIYSLLVRDIGVAVRAQVPMLAPSFKKLKVEEQHAVHVYLKDYYEIVESDEPMMAFIFKKAKDRFKQWKHDCRYHFELYGDPVPLEFLNRPHQWEYLVNQDFRNEAKIAECARAKTNRKKNPNKLDHHSGAKPFIFRAEEHMLKGHVAPHCAAALEVYQQCDNAGEKIKNLKAILETVEEHGEDGQVVLLEKECDILISTLGEQKGTFIKGMGAAVQRARKRRRGPEDVNDPEADGRVQELEERAGRAEERAGQAEERAGQAEERAGQAEERAGQADERAGQAEQTANEAKEESRILKKRFEELQATMNKFMAGMGGGASTEGL